MSLTLGVTVTGPCQPVAAEDGLATLSCGATLTNPGPQTQIVTAVSFVPGSGLEMDTIVVPLPAGTSYTLPTPPAGGAWIVGTETPGAAAFRSDLGKAGAITVGVLAGIGFVDLIVGVWALATRG